MTVLTVSAMRLLLREYRSVRKATAITAAYRHFVQVLRGKTLNLLHPEALPTVEAFADLWVGCAGVVGGGRQVHRYRFPSKRT